MHASPNYAASHPAPPRWCNKGVSSLGRAWARTESSGAPQVTDRHVAYMHMHHPAQAYLQLQPLSREHTRIVKSRARPEGSGVCSQLSCRAHGYAGREPRPADLLPCGWGGHCSSQLASCRPPPTAAIHMQGATHDGESKKHERERMGWVSEATRITHSKLATAPALCKLRFLLHATEHRPTITPNSQ